MGEGKTQDLGDPAAPSGSRQDGRAAAGVSPLRASIPIAEEPEHLPLSRRPNSQWEYGINYGARRVRGFMCRVDYECELGHASNGNKIYPCLDTLRRERTCVSGCGIVEVEVTLYRVIEWGRDDADDLASTIDSREAIETAQQAQPEGPERGGAAETP